MNEFVKEIYSFYQQNHINDDTSIKTLTKLCIVKEI